MGLCMRPVLVMPFVASAIAVVSGGAAARQSAAVTIAGCLVDSGAKDFPVDFATVHVVNGRDTTISDSTGFFAIAFVDARNRVDLEIRRVGYVPLLRSVTLPARGKVSLGDVAMTVSATADFFGPRPTPAQQDSARARGRRLRPQCEARLTAARAPAL